ncbi:cell division protein FtsQ/DivIB [Conchiformibius kuhniae]|uniref:Cell division protein FtsQ n=1 Tax=Conchiformibius kuhniae TaxID=211502 RepID=A0A8T9MYB9_9NEIS|nr:cell division protein FtsQ/DivIB [Conchiformibius kuhniae]
MNNQENSAGSIMLKALYGLVGVFLVGAGVRWITHHSYFHIATIDLVSVHQGEPLKYVDKQKLFDAVKPHLSGSSFYVDLDAAQEAARHFTWVSDVKIERTASNTITVTVKEHEPVARWMRQGQPAGLVDADGQIFQADYDAPLPEFDGAAEDQPQMVSQYKSFSNELKPLRLQILRLQYTPRSSWSMMLDNGIELRLGKQEVNTRMNRFVSAWQHSLREKALQLDYVDMRYPDGFATRNRSRTASNATEALEMALAADRAGEEAPKPDSDDLPN